jgi:hypothetical protein
VKRPVAGPQRPSRRFVRLVLVLRLAWLVPVTLIGLHYFLLNLHRLSGAMFTPLADRGPLAVPLGEAAAAAALLFFTWRIWKKTWLIVTDRLYPEKSALAWQIVWLILLLALPYWIYRG